MPEEHAKFSASATSRWLRCPGSIALSDLAPPEKPSVYALEGTDAHTLAELLLRVKMGDGADGSVERYQKHLAYCEEEMGYEGMRIHVQEYVDRILKAAQGHELHVEVRVDTSAAIGVEGQFGTADAVIVRDDCIEVHDLKYGQGKRVSAERNEQMMVYALGALDMFDLLGEIEKVKLVIHQIRLGDEDAWECSVDELRTFAGDLKRAAKLALSDEPPFNAGEEQCRWCKGKSICQHAATHALDVTSPADANDFADLTVQEFVQAMPVETFEAYYDKLSFVKDWLQAMHDRALSEAMAGTSVRYKAVQGRAGARRWKNEAEAENVMKSMRLKQDEMYQKKPITPTAAEKLLKDNPRKWSRLESLVEKPEGKPTVVPVDDKRPAITNTAAAADFEDLSDDLA